MRFIVYLLLVLPLLASGRTLYVDAAKGSDSNSGFSESAAKASIQAAADIATDDDVVLVYPGIYDPISIMDHTFAIVSKEGASQTIIDGQDESRCATLGRGDGLWRRVTLRGFTLMHGSATGLGGDGASGVVYGIVDRCIVKQCKGGVVIFATKISNSLIVNNVGGSSSGLLMHGDAYNCTIVDNDINGRYITWDNTLYNVLVWNSGNRYYTSPGCPENHINCFKETSDPCFVDAASGNYSLTSASPCIDAGGNAYVFTENDLVGNRRIANGIVDVGCYEYEIKDFGVVTNVTARQIQPWKGLIEINYELTEDVLPSKSGNKISQTVRVMDIQHGTNFEAKTFTREPTFVKGAHRLIWNAVADGCILKSTSVSFSVGIKEIEPPLYYVVDLAGGTSATTYPVTCLASVPSGGWADEYKTTKLVLRCIEAGTYIMGEDQTNESRRVTLTKPFYIGVFELTQRQWELVMGSNPSYFGGNPMRPVERVSYNMIRGTSLGSQWPTNNQVDADSFIGKLRGKTGIDFDLPTEAQWEYACRAGTTTSYSYGNDVDGTYMWHRDNSQSSTQNAGTKLPNSWGLYDMHGNVWEWCVDWRGSLTYGSDPKGASLGSKRIARGGGWSHSSNYSTSFRWNDYVPSGEYDNVGLRLFCPVSE